MSELQIHILLKDDGRYYVLLHHLDGREEISQQSFATRQECEEAIQQYVIDRGLYGMRPFSRCSI
jgi:hypothetical protein